MQIPYSKTRDCLSVYRRIQWDKFFFHTPNFQLILRTKKETLEMSSYRIIPFKKTPCTEVLSLFGEGAPTPCWLTALHSLV